jgi:hypothetical protein
MRFGAIAAATAIVGATVLGLPAGAATEDASAQTKTQKPLNLRSVAHKGSAVRKATAARKEAKRTRTAARHARPSAKMKVSFRKAVAEHKARKHVAARPRHAEARRFAVARRPAKQPVAEAPSVEAVPAVRAEVLPPASPVTVPRPNSSLGVHPSVASAREAAGRNPRSAPMGLSDPSALAAQPEQAPTDGTLAALQAEAQVPSQDEVNELDLAADANPPPATPTAATPPAATPPATPVETAVAGNTAPAPVPANQASSAAPVATAAFVAPAQPPAEDTSWLRKIIIGLGGVLTLASAVRLFAG